MKIARWGVLSTANINRLLIPAIRQSPNGELVAVSSRMIESAQAYARKWDIPKTFGSYQAMLDSDEVDLVYIGLPNHLHAEWTIKALKAGKHVLCEKPFALSLAEVDAVIAACEECGRVAIEAFMYQYHPQTRTLLDFLESGRLGEVLSVTSQFGFSLRNPTNVRLILEMGGGCMWDVGVYPMSLSQLVFGGPPVRVSAVQRLGETGVDVHFVGQMEYANGGLAQIESSFRTPFNQGAHIAGTAGYIEIERPFNGLEGRPREFRFYDADDNLERVPLSNEYLYLGEVEAMHKFFNGETLHHLTLQETRNHIRTALALYTSARERRLVELEEIN